MRTFLFLCSFVIVGLLGGTSGPLQAQSQGASNVIKLDMEVGRGERVEKAKMSVLPGKPARFTIEYKDGSVPGLRVQVIATHGFSKSQPAKPTVRLQFMLLERIADAWVLIGEPEISAFEGKPASMRYESDAGPVALKITALSAYSAKAASKAPAACPSLYSIDPPRTDVSPVKPGLVVAAKWPPGENCPQLPCPGPSSPGCCSMYCETRNQTMTCCGADECCGTGCGCCTPDL